MPSQPYDEHYYETVHLEDDRIALWWYARVVRRLSPQGGRLLDYGCGTGHLLKRLTGSFEAFGYDASAYARSRARLNAPDAVILEEWASLPVQSLGLIVSLHTLEHLRRPHAVVAQLAGLLQRGGIFFYVVPNTASLGRRLKRARWFGYRDATHHSLLSQGEWVSLTRQAGLDVLWVRGDGWWDAPYLPLLPTAFQRMLFGAPAALQVFSPIARPFLPAGFGECLLVAARRR
jgi:SAM-dependent methyltransferase